MTTKELQEKYPHQNKRIKYKPQSDCRACDGTGEHLNGLGEMTVCVCTCVNLEDIGGIFKDFVAGELRDLRGLQRRQV